MTRNYTIESEPAGSVYEGLIAIATLWCSMVQFVVRPRLGLSEVGRQVVSELAPYQLSTKSSSSWPGTVLFDGEATVYVYEFVPPVVTILTERADSLYQWQQPGLPEDLCCLRDETNPWLVSITHEFDSYLSLEPEELFELRNTLPALASVLVRDPSEEVFELPRSPETNS